MASVTSDVLYDDRCEVKTYHVESIGKGDKTSHISDNPPYTDARVSIAKYHVDVDKIFSIKPEYSLLLSSVETSKNPFFHGGCAYVEHDDELFITSNLLQPVDPAQASVILISRVKLVRSGDGKVQSVIWSKLRPPPTMPMPAGAIPWIKTLDVQGRIHTGVTYCSQGSLSAPGGIFSMEKGHPPSTILTNWFGAEFGCLSSIIHFGPGRDRLTDAYWVVDAGSRGFEAGFRRRPTLPAAVWSYNAVRGDLRMMTDDVHNPWGIALAPDGETVYVTDSNPVRDEAGVVQPNMTAGVYAFDVVDRSGSLFLTGKRLFARAAKGIPKGIICDKKGNVFAGCGDGVEIWNSGGLLLGVITVPAPVSTLSWGREGEMFICAEQTLWTLRMGDTAP